MTIPRKALLSGYLGRDKRLYFITMLAPLFLFRPGVLSSSSAQRSVETTYYSRGVHMN